MNKTELKRELASFIFIALMLCSIFSGMVSAENFTGESDTLSETLCYDDSASISGFGDPASSNSSDNNYLPSEIDRFLNANKPVFLFFYANWCHFCQQQKPVIDELEQEYADKIAFISVNAEKNPQAMEGFSVTGFPAMFLIAGKNEEGYVYQEFGGFTEKDVLIESFDYVIENGKLPEGSGSSSFYSDQTEIGNLFADSASLSHSGNSPTLSSSAGADIAGIAAGAANLAKDVLGANYTWGAKGWDSNTDRFVDSSTIKTGTYTYCTQSGCNQGNGLDCSGLVFWSYNKAFGATKHPNKCNPVYKVNADQQWKDKKRLKQLSTGTPVSDLRPGDLLYFSGHVAIYVGNYPYDDRIKGERYNDTFNVVNAKGKDYGIIPDKVANLRNRNDFLGFGRVKDYCNDSNPCTIDSCNYTTQKCEYKKKDCGESFCIGDKCTGYWCCSPYCDRSTGKCVENCYSISAAACDNPDDSYDVSTISSNFSNSNTISFAEIGMLLNGFAPFSMEFLDSLGEHYAYIDVYASIEELRYYPILVIPSGGLHGLDSSPTFRSKLEEYVNNGGTLIVFSQQYGYVYNALPGGEVSGYGWIEDLSCHYRSVGISTYHPILSGQDSVISDVTVDGYFTKYPENATILLTRIKNGQPAMIMYKYGNGTVIATTAYTDYAYANYQATTDGKNLIRDMITWAKDPKDIPDYASGDTIDIPIEITTNDENVTVDKVSFTVIDPDKNVFDYVNVSTAILPGETKTINFTYTAPSKLGIWWIDYSLYNNSNVTQTVYEVERFAVSKYAENPDGWVYQGEDITFSVTSDAQSYASGSDATFTIQIWNNGDTDENITVYWEWLHEGKNLLGSFSVPAHDNISIPYTYNLQSTWWRWRFWTFFYDNGKCLGLSSVGGSVFSPSVDINIETNRQEYAKGEDVSILLNLTNKQTVSHKVTVTLRALDPDNNKIFENSFNINLSASASENKTLAFTLPIDSEYGVYIVTVEANEKGNKIGSDSTYFKVYKEYSVDIGLDKPDKIYRIRQNMTVYMNATNLGVFPWNSMLNISIPSLDFNDTRSVTLNPDETESISYHLSIPENISAGKHDVIVTISYDNSIIQDWFFIPESKLQHSLEKTDYSAGENVSIKLENTGGVDTNYTYSAILQDPYLATVFEDGRSGVIEAGETIIFNYTIPTGAINGTYFLKLEYENLRTNETSSSIEMLFVSGLNALLTSKTDKRVYSAGEDITVLTNITNLDGEITGARLNLKVLSSKPPLPPEPCVYPTDDLYINSDTTLCPGIYNITDSGSNGVIIINASGVVVEGNDTVLVGAGNGYGIYNPGFDDVTIRDIEVKNYSVGIYLSYSSSNNIITNNEIDGSSTAGFFIEGNSYYNTIVDNKVNGDIYYHFVNARDLVIEDLVLTAPDVSNLGKVSLINCTNITLRNLTIANNYGSGVYVYKSSYITIANNNVSSNNYGIFLESNAYQNTITNNTANSNKKGIYLLDSSNNIITGNNARSSYFYDGVSLDHSSSNTITNNTVLNLYKGISLDYSSSNTILNNSGRICLDHSSNNIITSNNAIGGLYAGIWLHDYSHYNTITDNNASNAGYGIRLSSSGHNTITNNTVNSNHYDGIWLDYSHYNTITNNTANSNGGYGIRGIGIDLTYSGYNTITNNTVNSNVNYGIRLFSSSRNTLTNNTANSNNYHGIYLDYSSNNNIITNSTASNNTYGINLYGSSYNTLSGNTMSGNTYNFGVRGWSISHFVHSIDTTNKVDGKPVYYLTGVSNLVVDASTSAGYVGIINGFNVTVRDLTFTKNGQGVLFANTLNSSVENVTASNNSVDGIYLYSSSNNTLANNIANSNAGYGGIYLDSSNNNTLANNTANSNNLDGIRLLYSSNSNILTNNTANSNKHRGFGLYSSSRNTLTNSTANSNNNDGIYLYSSSGNTLINSTANSNNNNGIYLDHSSNSNTLTNSTANSNKYKGIFLLSSGSNSITNNTASNNYNGICILSSSYCNITNNNASNNDESGISLGSSRYSNITNNTVSNNYWGISLGLSSYNNITNNNASNNNYGIRLGDSTSNILTNNIANSNNYDGISLTYSSNGNTLTNNTASNNNNGIYLYYSSNHNVLTKNIFCSNSQYDIYNLTTENFGYNTTCNTTYNWNDEGTTNCTYLCTDSSKLSTSFVSTEYVFSNQPAVLDFIPDITVNETDLVVISPKATDRDNDTLTFNFTPPLNNSGMWQTTYGDAGIYTTTVSVSDGELTDSQNVVITVLSVSQDNTIDIIPLPTATPIPSITPAPTPTTTPTPIPTEVPNATQTEVPAEIPTEAPTEIQSTPAPTITSNTASNILKIRSPGLIFGMKERIKSITGISQILSPVRVAEGADSPVTLTSSSSNSNNESYTIWEQNLTINVTDFANISTYIGELNVTGKLYLYATLYSSTGQIIAYSISTFYITDKDLSLTVETDRRVYKSNETINIHGEVRNHGSNAESCNLLIKKDGDELFADAFTLNPGETHDFVTNTSSNTSFTLEGTVNGVTITDFVRVESPNINVSVIAPDVVGLSPFNVAVLIENIGGISADLNVSINSTWNRTIPEGESRLLETTMSIAENTTLNVTISGDIDKVIQKEIIFGENAMLSITPADTYLEGTVEIPFVIENTGLLDSEFNATFSIEGQTISQNFFVPKGENITDSVSFNLTKGAHLLRYVSPFETVNITINVLSPPEFVVTSILPEDINFTLGENVILVFEVENTGGSEGEVTLRLLMPDFEYTNRTWIRPGAEENISFNLTIPDDLEEKSYKGIYEVDGKRDEFRFFVQGAKISVETSLDKPLYEEGETAILTLNVDNERNMDLSLYSRVKFNEYDSVQNFTLPGLGSKTLTFNVPVNFTGDNKMLYTVYMDTGRSLYINSMYVYEKKPDVPMRLYTDKDVYNMGESVTVHIVDVTKTDVLNLTAPNFTYKDTLSGPTMLEFTLPELRSGTYYIEYTYGNFSSAHPFDVRGYSARIIEAGLDKEVYYNGDFIKLKINIEVNRNASGLQKTWIYDPENELVDEFAMNKTLMGGENKIEISRTLSTNISGIHVIVYGFYAELCGDSFTMLVSGAEYFDAEAVGLCGDVAPYPDCNGIVDMGDVILLLNNVSYPENPRYALCNAWAGDCRCNGVRDMGDVILLLNNVSYPEDPRYVLDCC